MSLATFLAGAKVKIALALAALIALAVALWEAYTKGRDNAVADINADAGKDLQEAITVNRDVGVMVHDLKPNVAPVDGVVPVAVPLEKADPDSSAGRLNMLVQD